MLLVLLAVLTFAAWPSIKTFGWTFLVTSQWRPNELNAPARDEAGHVIIQDGEIVMKTTPPVFGALPVIYGTTVSSLLAILFAVPLSFGAALFLVRLCPRWLAGTGIVFSGVSGGDSRRWPTACGGCSCSRRFCNATWSRRSEA